jgi:penicillin-binding protein 1C
LTKACGVALGLASLVLGAAVLAVATRASLAPLPGALPGAGAEAARSQILDREGRALTFTYQNAWNVHDRVQLHEVPPLLRSAFLRAEDQRFFEHAGVDWRARGHAVWQSLLAGRFVRGASTLTEQTVRMLHPRPRTLWSRWVEGFDAARLEARFSKAEILAFYLNQVPFARQRRGVAQAARDYFDRDLETLAPAEMLALAVLVRSPQRLDLARGSDEIRAPLAQLAQRMLDAGELGLADWRALKHAPLEPGLPAELPSVAHFARLVRGMGGGTGTRVHTTLDAGLQTRIQRLLDRRVQSLRTSGVSDAAALVVDHESGEVLAWVNAGGFGSSKGGQIDAVLVPRQPGSTLKPLLYGLALEKGWTAATLVEDSPLADAVGHGLHAYRNYSRTHYGPLRVRLALANSLNVPAIRTIRYVGRGAFLERLRETGITSLEAHSDHYGDGLALGNGEVSLFELVQSYAVLARGGSHVPLRLLREARSPTQARRVYSPEVSSLVADILSDPLARELEFGRGGVLDFPLQTAVKTGTSNDYRDAWALAFSHRYTVGIWMGNLDREPMDGITGSRGPGIALRGIFADLHRHDEGRGLVLDRRLARHEICRVSGRAPGAHCPVTQEWFRPVHAPGERCALHDGDAKLVARAEPEELPSLHLVSPTPGLHLAVDPRIPDGLESFAFRLAPGAPHAAVDWLVDGEVVGTTPPGTRHFLWPLARGPHTARARARPRADLAIETEAVSFLVK